MHGRKSARSRFGRANVGGSPLDSIEAVFRQDQGGGRRGKAERAGVTYLLPSSSSLVP
jgi:hypothetical protein